MSLETTNNKQQYSLVSSVPSSFAVPFAYWDTSEIRAILTSPSGDADLVEGTDYSLSDPGDLGTLTRLSTWDAAATLLTIVRELPLTQPNDLVNGAELDAPTLETMHDRAVAMIQQLKETIGRIVRFPVSDTTTSPDMPSASERANKVLAFDSLGNPIAAEGVTGIPVSEFMTPVVEATTELAAQKAFGILSSGAAAALPDLDQTLFTYPAGSVKRAARVPPSYDLNAILESGLYYVHSAGCTHYPSSCSANGKYRVDVFRDPLAEGAVHQLIWNLTLGPTSRYYAWVRQSVDGGTTWSTFILQNSPAVGEVYIQGANDDAPGTVYPGTTWQDVSSEEAAAFRRIKGTNGSYHVAPAQGAFAGDMMFDHQHIDGRRVTQAMSSGIYAYGLGNSGSSQPAGSESANGTLNFYQGFTSIQVPATHGAPNAGGETAPYAVGTTKWRRTA